MGPGEEVSEETQNYSWVIKHPLFSVKVNVPGLSLSASAVPREAGLREGGEQPGPPAGVLRMGSKGRAPLGLGPRPLGWMPSPPCHAAFKNQLPPPAQYSTTVTHSVPPPSILSTCLWMAASLPQSVCPSHPGGVACGPNRSVTGAMWTARSCSGMPWSPVSHWAPNPLACAAGTALSLTGRWFKYRAVHARRG